MAKTEGPAADVAKHHNWIMFLSIKGSILLILQKKSEKVIFGTKYGVGIAVVFTFGDANVKKCEFPKPML